MAKPQLDGYPRDLLGGKRMCVGTHIGPASYASVVVGATPSGGDTLYASEFGLKSFDAVIPMVSDNGQYTAFAIFPEGVAKGATSCILEWFTIGATGLEVTALTVLSARTMRILAIGD